MNVAKPSVGSQVHGRLVLVATPIGNLGRPFPPCRADARGVRHRLLRGHTSNTRVAHSRWDPAQEAALVERAQRGRPHSRGAGESSDRGVGRGGERCRYTGGFRPGRASRSGCRRRRSDGRGRSGSERRSDGADHQRTADGTVLLRGLSCRGVAPTDRSVWPRSQTKSARS